MESAGFVEELEEEWCRRLAVNFRRLLHRHVVIGSRSVARGLIVLWSRTVISGACM